MPSVAVLICKDCGATSQRSLMFGQRMPVLIPCSCGGRRQVTSVFRDRRKAEVPVPEDRRGLFA